MKFSAFTDYKYSSFFRTKNLFEVLSNYTIYDFRDKITTLRNLAFRQFQFFDSTSISFSRSLCLDFYSNIRLSERGELFWEDFKEKPADYYIDRTYSFILWFKSSKFIKFGIGYKNYSQRRYLYKSNEKVLDYTQTNQGPTGNLEYIIGNSFNLLLSGWYEIIGTQNQTTAKNGNLSINLLYLF